MERKSWLFLILIASFLMIPLDSVDGSTVLGNVEWGFQDGDHINYTLRMQVPELDIDFTEKVTVVVDQLLAAPNSVPSGSIPPFGSGYYYSYALIWRNGTPTWETMRVPQAGGLWSAVPIGNWSALNDLYGDIPEILTVEDSFNTWGLTMTFEHAGLREIKTYTYSKTDGVIQRCFMKTSFLNGSVTYLAEMIREGHIPDAVVIGGVIGAAAAILILGVLEKRRKG